MTAEFLARQLEVSTRTIYRDISALQIMNTPIDGEPGIGYMMRKGYDLPPLNFDMEEIEALRVGLALLSRTGDSALQRAAQRIHEKVDALHGTADWLRVAPWGRRSTILRRDVFREPCCAMLSAANANSGWSTATNRTGRPCASYGRWR